MASFPTARMMVRNNVVLTCWAAWLGSLFVAITARRGAAPLLGSFPMENLYQPPLSRTPAPRPARPNSASLVVLAGALLLMVHFALFDAIEEGWPLSWSIFLLLIVAGLQLPGLAIADGRRKTGAPAAIPMLVGAYLIAAVGCAAYAKYAFDGPADSLPSAAHLHGILFPILYGMFALATYLICGLAAAIVSVFTHPKKRDGPLDELNSIPQLPDKPCNRRRRRPLFSLSFYAPSP